MTPREINKLVEDYIGTTTGYLNHFTYSTHERFYHIYCDLEKDVQAYRERGLTTRRAFVEILKDANPREQARIIRGTFAMLPPPEEASNDEDARKIKLYHELSAIAVRLEADGEVIVPELKITSEVVFEALKDAEVLLQNRGPTSAVDRAHTALHGYLKKVCADRLIPLPTDSSLTTIFKVIREQFPEFKGSIAHDSEAKRVFGSIASALDSLNTIRNRATLAHPNELLLKAPEAMLYINLSRVVLAYLIEKLSDKP